MNSLKSLLKRVYTKLTAPLYHRLLRDVTIQVQDAHTISLDYQEKLAAKLLDELVCVRLEMERAVEQVNAAKAEVLALKNPPTNSIGGGVAKTAVLADLNAATGKISDKISDDEIHKIVNEISSHMKIVELACDTQIPMSEILDWRSKYSGLTVNAVRKMRRIEQENEYLKQELARHKLEASVISDAEIFS